MAEGTLTGKLNSSTIDSILVPGELTSPEEYLDALNAWAIPHWDWVELMKIGAVKISQKTAEYIIDKFINAVPKDLKQSAMMIWVNYGWSIRNMKDWMIVIDFRKIEYKKSGVEELPPTENMTDK